MWVETVLAPTVASAQCSAAKITSLHLLCVPMQATADDAAQQRAAQLAADIATITEQRDSASTELAATRTELAEEQAAHQTLAEELAAKLEAGGKEVEGIRQELEDKTKAAVDLEAQLESLRGQKVSAASFSGCVRVASRVEGVWVEGEQRGGRRADQRFFVTELCSACH